MRIAIPLQPLRYQGGIATYTQEVVSRMIEMDPGNHYILIYPTFEEAREDYGRYSHAQHVTEVLTGALVPIGHYWTQAVVPGVARRNRADIVFNPWLSIPLFGRYKKVFVMHGCEWYIMPEVFWFTERLWGRSRMTAYMKAADIVISVSQKVADVLSDATGLPPSRFRVIYNAAGDRFRPIEDPGELARVKQKYGLADDFLLFVGAIYPQKNFGTLLRAFYGLVKDVPHRLVVAGHNRWSTSEDMRLVEELGLEDRIDFLGWVDHDDLPALYNLATCFLIPSLFESCSVALVEAMSCGCPVIGANTGGNPEVVQDAAILLDPMDTSGLETAIRRVIADRALRDDLASRGLRRAADFGWDKSAARTLALLHELYESG
jgi:glycosyltransferase involved in cell wall biosynthesis